MRFIFGVITGAVVYWAAKTTPVREALVREGKATAQATISAVKAEVNK